MLNIAEQTINFYFKNFKTPNIEDLNIQDTNLLEKKWSLFVTLYKKWVIRWASWNIKEIKSNIIEEIIENTINALTKDSRFKKVQLNEVKDLKIRLDLITSRQILQEKEILQIDPTKEWVLLLKKDYSSMAVILANINPSLLTWEDLIPIIEAKFNISSFKEEDYIIYKIETKEENNFEIK